MSDESNRNDESTGSNIVKIIIALLAALGGGAIINNIFNVENLNVNINLSKNADDSAPVVSYDTGMQMIIESTPETVAEPIIENTVSLKENVISAYKGAFQSKIDSLYKIHGELAQISYSVYDIDSDNIPEFFIKYGTCEADYTIEVYTYKNNELKVIGQGIGASHSTMSYDSVNQQFVLVGTGYIYDDGFGGYVAWYDLDSTGNLRFIITESFDYGFEGGYDLEYFMEEYHIKTLDTSEYRYFSNETDIYRYKSDGNWSYESYDGIDFHLLESYPF